MSAEIRTVPQWLEAYVRRIVPNAKDQLLIVSRTGDPLWVETASVVQCEACKHDCWLSKSSASSLAESTVICLYCLREPLNQLLATAAIDKWTTAKGKV